ncbi:MAG: hypothetical protein JWL80_192 [Parcubacteria group bacterium]|nr:hypothetical protein [Parcubacteria group bacterium]
MKESQTAPFGTIDHLYITEVVPIQKGMTKETLSYFTKEELSIGSFVKIPLRNKEILGLVTQIHEASNMKTDLKSSSFALKKLSRSRISAELSSAFIQASLLTAEYYGTTIGSILGALIPKILLENPPLISSAKKTTKGEETVREPFLIQLPETDRIREYKSLIRESFARKRSVLFCVPTHEDAMRTFDLLSMGIEKYTYTTSNKPAKALIDTLKAAHKEPHPILFITTPAFISFDRQDLHTIILERENSRAYRTFSRPYINYKVFCEFLAKASGKTLIMGDSVLSLETLYKEKQGVYAELSPLKWRITRDSKSMLIDMKGIAQKQPEETKKTFEILSPELIGLIAQALAEKKKIFLFGARKGLAPSTSCRDCGALLACENCSSPMVLHKKAGAPLYICHACGARRSSETRCDNCKSWNLMPLGIGIDRIEETVSELFPEAQIFVLDKDHANTSTKARAVAKKFASQKGGILIGTEMAFPYLLKIPFIGLVSIDSLFSIPDFNINERIFYLVTRLLDIAEEQAIIQTRNIRKTIMTFAERGNILDFYRAEIEERKELSYPPISIFVKIQYTGTQPDIEQRAAYLKRLFEQDEPDFMISKGMQSGKLVLSTILRFQRDEWPIRSVREKLLLLPPEFSIKVDPESILS